MKTWCSKLVIVAVAVMAWVYALNCYAVTFDPASLGTSMAIIVPKACDGSNASDVCVLDDSNINSTVCIHSDIVNAVTKLKYTASKASCVGGTVQYLKRYWCQDGHTVKANTITCDAGDTCYSGQCHHYDAQTKIDTAYPNGTNAVGYSDTYGSTDAVSCSKQDNALQNICNTVDNNKGLETQFPNVWSRLKYYGGCK